MRSLASFCRPTKTSHPELNTNSAWRMLRLAAGKAESMNLIALVQGQSRGRSATSLIQAAFVAGGAHSAWPQLQATSILLSES